MTLEDEIQRLVDIEAIKQLRGRYSRADRHQGLGPLRRLARRGRASRRPTAASTRAATTIVASVSGVLATATTMHHQHTPEIEITGPDTATGIWAMQDIVHIGTFVLRGWGHYSEEYVRTAEGWKIKSSTLTRVRVDTEGEYQR